MGLLIDIIRENWRWRRQVWNLAKIDLVKTYRGAALGKIWLFVKPAVYILVFWVALASRSSAPRPKRGVASTRSS